MPLEGFDFDAFWKGSDYARRVFVEPAPTAEMVALVERELGYRLPPAYLELARHQNGGIPTRTSHRAPSSTTWAADHVAISGIFAIGRTQRYSLLGEAGSRFWIDNWEYPDIGIYFASCPSAGHDMVCLDYQECGPVGEPRVVHVDQEIDYRVTVLAPSFEAFVRGLEPADAFES